MKKLLATLLATTMAVSAIGGLAACGGDDEKGESLTIWCPDGAVACYTKLVTQFKKENPDVVGKVTFVKKGEGDVLTALQTDAETGADIFFFASDHVNGMLTNDFLQPLPAAYKSKVKARDGKGTIDPVEKDDEIYAFPTANSNGYFLIYDKNEVTADQAKSLDSLIAVAETKGKKIIYNYGNGFYNPTFFFGMGMTCGVAATREGKNVDIDNDKGLAATKTMIKYFGKKDVFAPDGGNNGIAVGLGDGSVIAGVSGTWCNEVAEGSDIGYMDQMLAEKGWDASRIGYTKLPSFTVNCGSTYDGTYQMGSFMGAKYCGINHMKSEAKITAALQLADYFTNEAGQVMRFEMTGECPTNTNAASSDAVKAAPMLVALNAQNAAGGIPQLVTPDQFWSAFETFGNGIYAGTTTNNNARDQLTALANALKA